MQPSKEAYDRASTIFSPDGRLFQVEYAREAVNRGTTTVGVKFKDGVVLIVDKRITSRLIEPDSIEKIFQIDEYIGCAISGLMADARVLVNRARIDAAINKITYDDKIPIKTLVKGICDFKQAYTQYGGARPLAPPFLSQVLTQQDHDCLLPIHLVPLWNTRPAAKEQDVVTQWHISKKNIKKI